MEAQEFTRRRSGELVALNHAIDDMRVYKSRAEQSIPSHAAEIAMGAHCRRDASRTCGTLGRMEYEMIAEAMVRRVPCA